MIVVFGAFLTSCRTTPEPAPAVPLTPEEVIQSVASFDYVWETVRDKHWEKEEPGGTNWEEVGKRLRPEIEQATTRKEARKVLRALLAELGQSHFGIVPGEVYDTVEADDPAKTQPKARDGRLGVTVRLVDDVPLVIATRDSAVEAGVKPGWILTRVGSQSVQKMLDSDSKLSDSKLSDSERGDSDLEPDSSHTALLRNRRIERLFEGPVGDVESLAFEDGDGNEQTVEIEFRAPGGKPFKTGMMPEVLVSCEARDLGDYGYFRLSAFLDPIGTMVQYKKAIRRFDGKKGLIIDLRGNPGGLGIMATGMAGHLIDDGTPNLGTMITRDGTQSFVVNPQVDIFPGPVAILVDENSASTSEIMAGGLQDVGRARIFGQTTAGAALPSVFVRLPNGDGFQYAFANLVRANGEPLEGKGVVPDTLVTYDRDVLLSGRDPFIVAATTWFALLDSSKN